MGETGVRCVKRYLYELFLFIAVILDANKLKKFDKEIQDLNELMPEIDSRIQDCQASIKQNENQKDEIQAVTQVLTLGWLFALPGLYS